MPEEHAHDPTIEGSLSSVLRPRVAWASIEGCPSIEELGLMPTARHAVDWQSHRNRGPWEAFALGVNTGVAEVEWVPEIFGLFGIAGELILSTIEASAEVEIARRGRESETGAPMRAALSRTMRFFAEGQANNLIVFGHTVANIAVRTLAMRPDFDVDGIWGLRSDSFVPRSDHPGAWTSLNKYLAKEVKMATAAFDGCSQLMADDLQLLTMGPWGELWGLRGEQYHRWRGESPGVSALNFAYPSMWDRLQEAGSVSLGDLHAPYVEGDRLLDELLDVVERTLAQVTDWMPIFFDACTDSFAAARDALNARRDLNSSF